MLRPVPELYGMYRTVVVARKARQTLSVMLPLRHLLMSALDVVYRTDLRTSAALQTVVSLHMERLVGDKPFHEGSTQHLAVGARPMPLVGHGNAPFPSEDNLLDLLQLLTCRLFFGTFFLGLVHIHEGQTHIAFWHDE